MTLYELNQVGYAKLPTLDNEAIERATKELIEFLIHHDGNYFMMLNHEIRYFTLYKYLSPSTEHEMAKKMIQVAQELGELKAVEINGDIAEFWVTGPDKVCRMYAVFNYDKGVIKV